MGPTVPQIPALYGIDTRALTQRIRDKVIANGDAQAVVADEQVRRVYLGSSFGEGITEEEERGLELD